MPIPDNVEFQAATKREWPLIPEDVYQCEITDIKFKSEPNRWKEKPTDPDEKQVMNFEFTIIEEGPMYGRKVWQKMSPVKPYPPSGTNSSWIYRLASAMEGHPITRGEADKFGSSNVNDYEHRQVRVTIKNKPSKNDPAKVYNNVESFLIAKTQIPPFDENKVPKEYQAEPKKEPFDARAIVSKHVPNIVPPTDDPTNGEVNLMVNDAKDEKLPDIPF